MLALTGVPGTGKTTVGDHLEDLTVVSANELARQVGAVEGEDEARGAEIVDERTLAERAPEALPEGSVVVEGHLAHHCPADLVVLLRCHPDELRRRLQAKGWPEAKVRENVMAETLDALVAEIEREPAREIDTTDRSPAEVADIIRGLFKGEALEADGLDPMGTVDWTDTLAPEDAR